MLTTSPRTTKDDKIEIYPISAPKNGISDLWERVLGQRFRTLPSLHQRAVIAAVGHDDGFCCPLAVAYGQPAFLWGHEWEGLVSPMDFQEFTRWHDRACGVELAPLRAWLTAQMEGR